MAAELKSTDFEITLSSNHGAEPGSTANHYTCTQNPPIELDSTFKWDVGVKRISCSRQINLLGQYNKNATLHIRGYRYKRLIINVTLHFPENFTAWNPHEFLKMLCTMREYCHMPRLGSIRLVDFNDCFRLIFEESTRKFKGLVLYPNPARISIVKISSIHPQLCRCFGITSSTFSFGTKKYKPFPGPVDLFHEVQFMDLRCDVLDDESLGLHPLLAWMLEEEEEEEEDRGMLNKTIKRPFYRPCPPHTIHKLSVWFQNERGHFLTFGPNAAPTSVQLSFKRCGKL